MIAPLTFSDEISVETFTPAGGEPRVRLFLQISPELRAHLEAQGIESAKNVIRKLESHENIAFRAAERFFLEFPHLREGVSIDLLKRIPLEAGLGGGSSNCASTLLALADLFQIPIGVEIESIAAELGSDVPALLKRRLCFMTGRGETVNVICEQDYEYVQEMFTGVRVLLVKPPWGCETARMYSALAEKRRAEGGIFDSAGYSPEKSPVLREFGLTLARDGNYLAFAQTPLTLSYREGNGEGLSGRAYRRPEVSRGIPNRLSGCLFENDFETVYYRFNPQMTEVRDRLLEGGAERVFLAGSGSTLVGLFVEDDSNLSYESDLVEKGYFLHWTEFQL